MTDTAFNIPGYRIERLLGRGGMAEVYLAEQLSLGRKVAIKLLDANTADPEFASRFLHEARLVATLNHANLITIHDFGQLPNGKLFLSMEYLQGDDLEKRLLKGVDEKSAVQMLRELVAALRFVHTKGIVHRDIKPANILFREDGSLVLTDFGIAKRINNDVSLTQAGTMVGSAAYGSPEQMQGLELDGRSDIYSVGVLLLEMLTGKNPFKASSFVNTAMNHIQMDVPTLPAMHARFQPLLDKMLAKKPKERFASMDELMAALDSVAPVTGVHAIPDFTGSASSPNTSSPHNAWQKIAVPPVAAPVQRKTEAIRSLDQLDDDFLSEAKRLLQETDRSLSGGTSKDAMSPGQKKNVSDKTVTGKTSKAGSDRYSNFFSNSRSRPLPGNLLDDD